MATKEPIGSKNSAKPENKSAETHQEFESAAATIAATLFDRLASPSTPEPVTEEPVSGLENDVSAIFSQASDHRDTLVKFFIVYTSIFSGFVAFIIIGQALVRTFMPGKENIELVPYWALNLLVVGLIGQFISLLTIVTKKVWQLTDFFNYARSRYSQKSKKPTNKNDE